MWPYHGTWVEIRGWPRVPIFAFQLRISFCFCLIACLFSADYVKLGYPWTSEKSPLWAFTQRVIQLTPLRRLDLKVTSPFPEYFGRAKQSYRMGKLRLGNKRQRTGLISPLLARNLQVSGFLLILMAWPCFEPRIWLLWPCSPEIESTPALDAWAAQACFSDSHWLAAPS